MLLLDNCNLIVLSYLSLNYGSCGYFLRHHGGDDVIVLSVCEQDY